MNKDATYEEIEALLDKRYDLIYIDYRESMDDNLEEVQQAIHEQEWYPLDEAFDFMESVGDSVQHILENDLKDELDRNLEIAEDDEDYEAGDEEQLAEDLIEKYRDQLVVEIEDRDRSTPLDDLFRNTRGIIMFYDTGVEVEGAYDEEDLNRIIWEVKKAVGLKKRDTRYDDRISLMVQQASYGGRLVVYWLEDDAKSLIQVGDVNRIVFSDPMIAITNSWNGSGDHTALIGHKFSLPFEPGNIFIDKTIKYSYVYEVCGLVGDWCKCTGYRLEKRRGGRINRSGLHAEMEVEAEYNRVYRAGGCSAGDMDIRRHRHTYYRNEPFSCGLICRDCRTFWID